MLCSQYSQLELKLFDGSSRIISPCRFLMAHYTRLAPLMDRLLRKYGKRLHGWEGTDVLHELYVSFAARERRGIWAPVTVGTDADLMSKYVLGMAKQLIIAMDETSYEYREIPYSTVEMGASVEEFLEREELIAEVDKLSNDLQALIGSFGVDTDVVYEVLGTSGITDDTIHELADTLCNICYVTKAERNKLHRILCRLREIRETIS